jgi:protein TonB
MKAAPNAFVLHAPTERTASRWIVSATVVVALHVGLIAGGLLWYRQQESLGSTMPAIMVDMAPATTAPEDSEQDVAPGPEMQQAEAPAEPPPPEPVPQPPPPPAAQAQEMIPPTPPIDKPEVEAPPEPKAEPSPPTPPIPEPEPPRPTPVPEPAKTIPDPPQPVPAPAPLAPKPLPTEVKKQPSDTPPAPRTSAAPRAERRDRAASSAAAGAAAAAALPSYRDRLNAHLQRYKEPSATGKQGVATLTFTVSRNGQVLGSRISGSSGTPELDAATLALIRRAQPLPAFPPELTQTSMSFSVGIRYVNR